MRANAAEALAGVENHRDRRVLTNDDYAAGGIQLLDYNRIVESTPGADGVLALSLPYLHDVEMGALFTIVHHGTTNNTTVDDKNDGLLPVGQSVLTADLDHVVFQHCGTHWKLIDDVTT